MPSAPTRMSSTMRTPWPSRSAPHHCSASQMDGSPNPSPAWIVMWKFSRGHVLERVQVPGRRAARLGPGDVESDHALIPVPHRKLRDLQRARRGAHRGEQRVDGDAPAHAADPESVEHRRDHLLQGESPGHVQLGREPHLRVDHAVVGEILGALGRHPGQRLRRLHDRHRVLERVQVVLEVAAVGATPQPPGDLRPRRPRAAGHNRSHGPARPRCPAAGRHQGDRAAAPWEPP